MKKETLLPVAESATKQNATWTPGPWALGPSHYSRDEIERTITATGVRVTTISYRNDQPTIGEANARLISAAPDLLAACAAAITHWHANARNFERLEPEYLKMTRAAIAKATTTKTS